jgi:hypothetical protein
MVKRKEISKKNSHFQDLKYQYGKEFFVRKTGSSGSIL